MILYEVDNGEMKLDENISKKLIGFVVADNIICTLVRQLQSQ